jgi:hypothetical protein
MSLSLHYTDFCREAMRPLGMGKVYHAGTVAIASGVVTLTGGAFPSWAGQAVLQIGDDGYTVDTRDNGTQVTLDDTSINVPAGRPYALFQTMKRSDDEWYRVRDWVRAGERQFYYPQPLLRAEGGKPVLADKPHQWSFLNPVAVLSLTEGQYVVNLPDDFGQDLKGVTFSSDSAQSPIKVVTDTHLRALRARGATAGVPKYVSVRPQDFTGTGAQKFAAAFHPTPDAGYLVEFAGNVVPLGMNPDHPYPLGGGVHAETILASIQLVAEDQDAGDGAVRAKYMERLASSVQYDLEVLNRDSSSWSLIEPEYGHFDWFRRATGDLYGFGADDASWNHEQRGRVNRIVQAGIRRVYYNQHDWHFLKPEFQFQTVSGVDDYVLDGGCGGLIGELSIDRDGGIGIPLKKIAYAHLLRLRSMGQFTSAHPLYYSEYPLASGGTMHQKWGIGFHPTPGSSVTVRGRMRVIPPELSDDHPFPYGGPPHVETFLESCLALVEQETGRQSGHIAAFGERLAASVQYDSNNRRPEFFGGGASMNYGDWVPAMKDHLNQFGSVTIV